METKSLTSSAAIMATGTLVSRFLGLVRAAMLAASIATVGGAANAFSVANKLPTIIYMLIAGGVLNAVLVPQIVRAMRAKDGGQRYVNQLLTLGTSVLAGITAILTAGASLLLTLYAANMSADWRPLALTFAYICVPQLFFYGVYTLLGQVLNARGNFGPYMWAPALNNVVSIIGLGIYLSLYGQYHVGTMTPADWDSTRIWLVAGTATAGIAAQALVLIIPLQRSGFRFSPVFSFRGSGLGRASRVAGWAFAALLVGQFGYLVISNLAVAAETAGAKLGITVAANAAYDHAFTIFMLPQSLITVSLVTAMFTRLSHHAAAGEVGFVRDQLSLGLRTLSVFTVFATGALVVLAIPIVALVLAGSPAWDAQQAIGYVVIAFALGLVPIGAWTMIQRVYFAYEDTRTLFHIQIPMMLIVVASSAIAYFLFPPQWWVAVGAALGTTASNSFGAVVAYLALRKKLPSLDGARVLRTHIRVVIAVIPATVAGFVLLYLWGVQAGLLGSLLRVMVIGLLMGLIYLVLLRVLKVSELDGLMQRVLNMARPLTRRLEPVLSKLPGSAQLRKIGSFFAPSEEKAGVVSKHWDVGEILPDHYHLTTLLQTRTSSTHTTTVWQARDESLGEEVRVEFFTAEPKRLEAALDAARRRAVLSDPHLPKIHRVLAEGDYGIIISQILDGPTLTDLIEADEVTPDEVRSVVGETATVLERMHRRGTQHLALTPDSILLSGGSIMLLGLGHEAALAGIETKSPEHGARKDAIALAQVLMAGLSGRWMGAAPSTLPTVSSSVASAEDLHDLAPQAPLDLIKVVYLTTSPFEQGPHTPGQLAESLRPWAPVPIKEPALLLAEDFATGSFTPISLAPVNEPEETDQTNDVGTVDPVDVPPADAAPDLEQTESTDEDVEGAPTVFDLGSSHRWDVPVGTPEPVVERAQAVALPPAQEGESIFSNAPSPTFTPTSPPPQQASPSSPIPPTLLKATGSTQAARERLRTLTDGLSKPFKAVDEQGDHRRFNPAPFVLLTMLALVVFALVLATSNLRSAGDFDPSSIPPPNQNTAPSAVTPSPTAEDEDPQDPEEDAGEIHIGEAITYDPSTGGGENQDIAHRAIDGDLSTMWRSLRYNNPTYGIKSGLAYSVVLENEATVSAVVLTVNGRGGMVEIRAGDPRNPTDGEVLASGLMDGITTFALEKPVRTDTIVLWFPELPVANSDGMNRIELAEIEIK